jgi:hypothetical protein
MGMTRWCLAEKASALGSRCYECRPRVQTLTLDELTIDDERSYRHIGLYEGLKEALIRDKVKFFVLGEKAKSGTKNGAKSGAKNGNWDRALFLNLTFWSPDQPGDVLVSRHIPADVVMHAAWHHVASRAIGGAANTAESLFLGESIASAFDVYLLGRLVGHAPNSEFLRTQVPAMSEVAKAAGLSSSGFARLLQSIASDPDGAFEDLRSLLFDVTRALFACASVKDAARAVDSFNEHRFAPLLHHYEVSNWILYARAYATARLDARSLAVDDALRHVPIALDWLEDHWLTRSLTRSLRTRGEPTPKKAAFSAAHPIKKANLARRGKRS